MSAEGFKEEGRVREPKAESVERSMETFPTKADVLSRLGPEGFTLQVIREDVVEGNLNILLVATGEPSEKEGVVGVYAYLRYVDTSKGREAGHIARALWYRDSGRINRTHVYTDAWENGSWCDVSAENRREKMTQMPSKEDILAFVPGHEAAKILKEESDGEGICALEIQFPETETGVVISYSYRRWRQFVDSPMDAKIERISTPKKGYPDGGVVAVVGDGGLLRESE